MGRLRELINIFINPVQPEKSLDELAIEAGIEASDLELLKKSANRVEEDWEFADDVKEPKKGRSSRVTAPKETQVQPETKKVAKEQKADYERD